MRRAALHASIARTAHSKRGHVHHQGGIMQQATYARRRSLVYLGIAALFAVAGSAEARITKVTIASKESPTFGGYSWPGVGQYEKILGTAYGELDPNDPHNAVITDIKLAPRN